MLHKKIRDTLFACIICGALTPSAAFAGPGDLLVSPVRVVFEGRERVAEVTLVNKGDARAVYRVSFENRRMNRSGAFEPIETPAPGELFAEGLVRYAPRRVELEPNTPQTLRLMLRKPEDLPAGEYRSHLHFAAVPLDVSDNLIESAAAKGNDLSIRLTPIYGVTIPVVVRHGVLTAAATFKTVEIDREAASGPVMRIILGRSGEMSLYGDIDVYVEGDKEPVVSKRGIAIYVPNAEREVTLPLDPDLLQRIAGKTIRLEYADQTNSGADIAAVATAQLN